MLLAYTVIVFMKFDLISSIHYLVGELLFFVTNFIQNREFSSHAFNLQQRLFSKLVRGPHGKWNTVNIMTHQTKTNVCQFNVLVLFIFNFAKFNMSLYKIR